MSRSTYPLKLPTSVKTSAARLAKADGVSLNQLIDAAVAEKVGVMETARDFLGRRAGSTNPRDLLKFLRRLGGNSRSTAIVADQVFDACPFTLPRELGPPAGRPASPGMAFAVKTVRILARRVISIIDRKIATVRDRTRLYLDVSVSVFVRAPDSQRMTERDSQ